MDGRAIDAVAGAFGGLLAPGDLAEGATWRDIVDTAPDGVLVVDGDGRLLHATTAARALLGLDANRLLAAYTSDYLGLAGPWPPAPGVERRRVLRADGRALWVQFRPVVLADGADGRPVVAVHLHDVSARARTETFTAGQTEILRQVAAAAPLESTMRALVELADDHLDGGTVALLPLGEAGEGRSFCVAALPPGRLESLVHAVGLPPAGEVRVVEGLEPLRAFPDLVTALRADEVGTLAVIRLVSPSLGSGHGRQETLGALVCLLPDSGPPGEAALGVLHTAAELAAIAIERERAERDLAHQALHDELTGLANRHLLVDRLEQALNRAKRRGRRLALVFLDLDRFKTINDTLGHDVGDSLLRQFAERLRLLVRPEDTVARFGGDEFVVLVEHLVDEQEATLIADRLAGATAEPFDLGGRQLAVTASVGIVIGKGDEVPADLLRNADTAMYRAKELGRNRTEIYDTRLEAHLADRTELGADLRTALAEDQLRLVYQPVVDLRTGEMRMIEALVRWDHPRHGRLLPLEFLAVAEETGQAHELAAWVVERALGDLAAFALDPAWATAPGWPRPPRLSINLSAQQLAHPELRAHIETALARHGFVPQNLAVDVSERVVATAGEHVLRSLEQLHACGIGIVLDDVGGTAGTALLAVLERVPADMLKVDPSVITSMDLGEPDDGGHREALQRSMAAGLLGLGKGLGLTVVAEGVDNQRRLQQLRRLGFDLAQGNVIAAPVEADQLITLLPG